MTGLELAAAGSLTSAYNEFAAAALGRLFRSATMGGLIDVVTEAHVGDGLLLVAALVLGVALGAFLIGALYACELGQIARFLSWRDRSSNARVAVGSSLPGASAVASAINDELDATAEERDAASRAADEFARGLSALSHDVRTPLMGARGYLQLARSESDAAARNAQLERADERLAAMGELLDSLFSYARASDPDTPCELGRVCVQPLVERVLLGHYPEFEERGWEPEVDLGPAGASLAVLANEEALGRIVENLVVNALRHGSGPPCVTGATDGEGRVRLRFSNPVADPAALDPTRMFDRFYQADDARGGAGSGLGLSVAAALADAQGMTLAAALEGDVLSIDLLASRA